ncbi:hypothetical protein BsWGS_19509 [Bradybaena similaris]
MLEMFLYKLESVCLPSQRVVDSWSDDPKSDKRKAKAKPVTTPIQLTNVPKVSSKSNDSTPTGDVATKPAQGPKPEVKVPTKTETLSNSASNDLLGLDLGSPHTNKQAAAPPPSSGNNELLDLFGGPQMTQPVGDSVNATSGSSDLMNGASDGNLFGEDKAGGNVKTSAKDSIMALYGGAGAPAQPQMYGVPGGVYMPQSQPMYPGMMPQQQGMMGMQGIRQQGMMVAPQGMGMMGQGMMGQPHGMMGNAAMNPQQMAMYNSPIMGANPGMYPPQQLQFQQMQQQMTSLKLNGPQMGAVPQQTTGVGWGNPGPGQTLSTNLWQ